MVMSNSDTKTHTTTGEGGESVTKVENGTKNAGPNKRKSKKVQPSDGSVSWELAEEVVEGRCLAVMADLEDKIKSDRFTKEFIKQLSGNALSVAHFQREGFDSPIFVSDKGGLGIKVPNPKTFTVGDVRAAVGSRRTVDVMDVQTQKNKFMTMKDWQKYFDTAAEERTELLNVISLEISNTKLDTQIQAPKVVRHVDWVDKVWPRHLKEMQIEATNNMDDMMYPKVQKYCLMSVKGCFTDFHIDLGGTSVWYHILKGGKIFWLIPPTDENLKKYEKWVLSGKQSDVFFGDMVEKCGRFQIPPGGTFFIPSGWIHAVYTVQDSIVFGGNFLHSFSIEKQLQVAHIEEITHVPNKFRFPFFTEMLWYALDRFCHCVLGRTHLDLPEEEKRRMRLEKGENIDPNKEVLKIASSALASNLGADQTPTSNNRGPKVHLTQVELRGLKFMVMYLHHLPHSKKNVPVMIPDPVALIKDIRLLVVTHKDDCPNRACNGKYVLRWNETDDVEGGKRGRKTKAPGQIPKPSDPNNSNQHQSGAGGATATPVKTNLDGSERKKPGPKPGSTRKPKIPKDPTSTTPGAQVGVVGGSGGTPEDKKGGANRRRRVRCKNCEACTGGDCQQCAFCKDMVKYGGPGKMKQTCEKRRCMQPQLPVCAYCSVCKLDGWYKEPKVGQNKENERPEEPPNLFECTVCLDIMHPECAEKTIGLGKINPDLSNSWECNRCLNSGYASAPSRAPTKRPAPVTPTSGVEPDHSQQAAKRLNLQPTPPPHGSQSGQPSQHSLPPQHPPSSHAF